MRMLQDRERAKAVFAAIVVRWPGSTPPVRTVLYKAFYVAHLWLMTREGAELTAWPIVKMPNGPGPDRGSDLLQELNDAGAIVQAPTSVGPYMGYAYSPGDAAKHGPLLSGLKERGR
jgi:hypothetical protein